MQANSRLPGPESRRRSTPGIVYLSMICMVSRKLGMHEGFARFCRQTAEFLVQRAAGYSAPVLAPASAMPASAARSRRAPLLHTPLHPALW